MALVGKLNEPNFSYALMNCAKPKRPKNICLVVHSKQSFICLCPVSYDFVKVESTQYITNGINYQLLAICNFSFVIPCSYS